MSEQRRLPVTSPGLGAGRTGARIIEASIHEERVQGAGGYAAPPSHDAAPCVIDGQTAAQLAEIFKALSDPTRIRIVSLLSGAELCVCDLAAALDMSQSAVSHQLRTLRDLRLIRRRREGRHIFYTLDDEHVADLYRRGLEHATELRAHR